MGKVNKIEEEKEAKVIVNTKIIKQESSNDLINSSYSRENQKAKIEYVTKKSKFQKFHEYTTEKAAKLIGKTHNLTTNNKK